MNQFVPEDWSGNMGDALPPLSGEDDGLVELLWCSGHVVMQSQAPPMPAVRELEATPWFQYPIDESLEKDLFSEIFCGMPGDGAGRSCKEEDKERGAADAVTAIRSGRMPPPLLTDNAGLHGDSSVVTMGFRWPCGGSNEAQTPHVSDTAGDDSVLLPLSSKEARSYHSASATLTTSSTWSRPSGASKRKQSDRAGSPSEGMQEDVESESADVTCETAQKPTTAKRRRAAQVHNLSERRRRDRINEKMRALQELVPHCNKTDKASMLDEAIEYLKSLQLQLQLMSAMGGRMGLAPAPVMFPAGAHQFMQRMAAISTRMPPFRTCVYSSNDPELS